MLDVELVDAGHGADERAGAPPADGVRPDDATPGEPGPRSWGPPRRVGRWRVPVVAAVVLAVLAAVVVDRVGEADRLRALATVPGVVAPMPGPVGELWRIEGPTGSELRAVGTHLVGLVASGSGSLDVAAVDPRTGEDVWRTPVGPTDLDLWTRCVVTGPVDRPVRASDRPVSACVVVEETATTEQSALGAAVYPTRVRLAVVDALTGTLLSDRPVEPTTHVAALGSGVLVDRIEPDGRARVALTDPRTGRERWVFTTPGPVPTDDFAQRSATVQARDGVVVLEAGGAWVLSGDGDLLRSWPATPDPLPGPGVQLLGGDLLARTVPGDDGGWATEVLDLGTGRTVTVPGHPLPARPDDGSLEGFVLLQSADGLDLVGYDLATGRARWTFPAVPGSVPMILGGRVLSAGGDRILALDGRSGEVVWTTELTQPTYSSVVTDGRVVLISRPDPSGGGLLDAYGVEDGRLRWSAPTDGELFLSAQDGRLFGWSSHGLVALGPVPAT